MSGGPTRCCTRCPSKALVRSLQPTFALGAEGAKVDPVMCVHACSLCSFPLALLAASLFSLASQPGLLCADTACRLLP